MRMWSGHSLAVPTSTDKNVRQELHYAVPTGFLPLALEPYKSQLRALGIGTGPTAVMRVMRWGRDTYEDEWRQSMARVETGDWEGLFEFIAKDYPNRLKHDERVRAAFTRWITLMAEAGQLELVHRKLGEWEKYKVLLHEADGRQVLAGLGEGIYRGRTLTYMRQHGMEWDRKARAEATLKDKHEKWWPVYYERFLTQSFRYLSQISAPATNVAHVSSGLSRATGGPPPQHRQNKGDEG